MPKGRTKKMKCARGTTKTVVVSMLTPQARQLITNKGGKGTKSLLKKRLALKTCRTKEGAVVVRRASLTTAKLTPGGMPKAPQKEHRPRMSKRSFDLYNQPTQSDYVEPPPSPTFLDPYSY